MAFADEGGVKGVFFRDEQIQKDKRAVLQSKRKTFFVDAAPSGIAGGRCALLDARASPRGWCPGPARRRTRWASAARSTCLAWRGAHRPRAQRRRPVACSTKASSASPPPSMQAPRQPPWRQASPESQAPEAPPTNMPLMNSVLRRLRASGRRA